MDIQDLINELMKIEDKTAPLEVLVDGTIVGVVILVNEGNGEPYIEVRDE